MTNEHFYKKNTKDGLNSYCIPCSFKKSREWVDNNPDKQKVLLLRKVANKTEVQKQRSRDSARERNLNGKHKKWQQENKDKIKKYREKRLTHKEHEISDFEWASCKVYFNNSCAYCGLSEVKHREIYNQRLHKEHAINDGKNDISNCIPSCKLCNGKKWILDFNDWYIPSNEVYTEQRYLRIINWLMEDCHKIHN